MKITISEIAKNEQGNNTIKFTTEYGNAYALWNGSEPQINKEYIVELEIPGVLCWRRDIISAQEKYLITTENNKFSLVGIFESIDDDGYAVIRLGESIISIETTGDFLELGSFVKLFTDSLLLYEVNY